jgi:hypothetical protein
VDERRAASGGVGGEGRGDDGHGTRSATQRDLKDAIRKGNKK